VEGGSWELQACQPDRSAGQDYEAIHPECTHQACEGQPGDQAQPAWVHERQDLLDQPLVDEGKAVDIVCLDFSKALDTVPHSILLEKLAAHGLDGCSLLWIKNWLNG